LGVVAPLIVNDAVAPAATVPPPLKVTGPLAEGVRVKLNVALTETPPVFVNVTITQ